MLSSLLRRATSAVQPAMLQAAASKAALPAPLQGGGALSSMISARCLKVMSALKKRCESCVIVKRGKLTYVYCKANPRHNCRNGPKRRGKGNHE